MTIYKYRIVKSQEFQDTLTTSTLIDDIKGKIMEFINNEANKSGDTLTFDIRILIEQK